MSSPLQKAVFYTAKGHISQHESIAFTMQKHSFYNVKAYVSQHKNIPFTT